MVNVTKANFLPTSTALIRSLPHASFVALDLEMTGITLPGSGKPHRDDTPGERYQKLRAVPERYGIIQVGVAVFSENEGWRRWADRANRKDGRDGKARKAGRGGKGRRGRPKRGDDDDDESDDDDDDDSDGSAGKKRSASKKKRKDSRGRAKKKKRSGGRSRSAGSKSAAKRGKAKKRRSRSRSRSSKGAAPTPSSGVGRSRGGGGGTGTAGRTTRGGGAPRTTARRDAPIVDSPSSSSGEGDDGDDDDDEEEEEDDDRSIDSDGSDDDDDDDDDDDSTEDEDDYDHDDHDDVHEDGIGPEPAEFTVRKYNFYLFPPSTSSFSNDQSVNSNSREIVLNPSTVQFLNSNNIDWNVWTREGVPYVTAGRGRVLREKFQAKYDEKESEERNKKPAAVRVGGRVQLSRPDDVAFVARTMAGLREWIDAAVRDPPRGRPRGGGGLNVPLAGGGAAADMGIANNEVAAGGAGGNNIDAPGGRRIERNEVEGVSYILPSCNAFLRRALYETIEEEYPTLILEKLDGGRIKVLRLNPEEKKARDARMKREEWERLHRDQIGFLDVFEALSAACRGELVQNDDGGVSVSAAFSEEGKENDDAGGNKNPLSRLSPHTGGLSYMSASTSTIANEGGLTQTSRSTPHLLRRLRKRSKSKKSPKKGKKSKSVSTIAANQSSRKKQKPRQVPLIVHNGLMDLLFLLTHFHSPNLPASYTEAKALINSYFPLVYDTKILSTECADDEIRNGNTALGELHGRVCVRGPLDDETDNGNGAGGGAAGPGAADAAPGTALPSVVVLGEDPENSGEGQMHEASYDAYMTGAVFHGLCRRIMRSGGYKNWQLSQASHSSPTSSKCEEKGVASLSFLADPKCEESAKFFGRNKLYLMTTLYTIDLEKTFGDHLHLGMMPETTYRVTGIDKSVSTRDIIRALNLAADEYQEARPLFDDRRVGFEIIWVDDNTFMVATRAPNDGADIASDTTDADGEELIVKHGRVIENALRRRFPAQRIITLKQHLERRTWSHPPAAPSEQQEVGHGRLIPQLMLASAFTSVSESISGIIDTLFRKRARDGEEEEMDDEQFKRRRIGNN